MPHRIRMKPAGGRSPAGAEFRSRISGSVTPKLARAKADRNGRSSSEQGPQARKDKRMIAVALVIAWCAVVGLVLIARGDYRSRRPIR
jgi:hypothetical protein